MKKPVYVRELSRHTAAELADLMQLDIEQARRCIQSLAALGVLSASADALLIDDEEAAEGEGTGKYQFTWVGVAIFGEQPIVVYPKYMSAGAKSMGTTGGISKMRQVLRVIRKAAASTSPVDSLDDGGLDGGSRLALVLALIDSYSEYGIYSNYIKVNRQNGNGSIDWGRTIERFQPFLSNGTPIYFEYDTSESSRDLSDYVTRLHRCVLTLCSKYLTDTGLGELLGIDPIEISSESLEDFGEADYALYRLERERATQFVTWKQAVIDMLRSFLSNEELLTTPDNATCFGTRSFQSIWELACKVAFGDELHRPIGELGINLSGRWLNERQTELIDLIPRPIWTKTGKDGAMQCGGVSTLIPDVISVYDMGGGESAFCIYDAKYYTPKLGKATTGVPGVESVTKQILYQRAYRDFIRDNHIDHVANVFIVPADGNQLEHLGSVEFSGVFDPLGSPFVDGVEMWALPARYMFDCYLGDALAAENIIRVICGMRSQVITGDENAPGL